MLRAIVGVSTLAEIALTSADADSVMKIAVASMVALAAVALVVGFLTPVVSALIAIMGAITLVSPHTVSLHLLESRMALFELVAMAGALAILGPGATSIDARLFGRREVSISETHPPEAP